jgi:hypothetical protein
MRPEEVTLKEMRYLTEGGLTREAVLEQRKDTHCRGKVENIEAQQVLCSYSVLTDYCTRETN